MEEKSTAAKPEVVSAHVPAMDVVAPAQAAAKPEAVAVKPAPPEDALDPKEKEPLAKTDKDKAAAKSKVEKPKAPKKPGNGVGMAIVATVIIVFGLAAMATYAYIKTQN
jgi:hypothetical protein